MTEPPDLRASGSVAGDPFYGLERVGGERTARLVDLAPLPHEGGLFRRTHLDAHASVIYYLFLDPDVSALHALTATETYHWYAGSPLRLLLLHADGKTAEPVLGPDLAAGQRPQLVVPAGPGRDRRQPAAGRWWAPPPRRRSTGRVSGSASGTR